MINNNFIYHIAHWYTYSLISFLILSQDRVVIGKLYVSVGNQPGLHSTKKNMERKLGSINFSTSESDVSHVCIA